MDWDSWSEVDKNLLKESKNWFHWWYYGLSAIPILVGSFFGATGGTLRFFPLILLVLTVFFGKTAVSLFALLLEKSGKSPDLCDYLMEKARIPFEEGTLRFIANFSAVLAVVLGFTLCLVSGFGLLTFGILGVLLWLSFLLGYSKMHYSIPMLLGFFGQGFLLTAAAFYGQQGSFSFQALAIALPLGLLLSALVLRSEKEEDGFLEGKTLTASLGSQMKETIFTCLFVASYGFVALNILYGVSGFWCLLLFLLLPLAKRGIRTKESFFAFYLKFGLLYGFCMLLSFTF